MSAKAKSTSSPSAEALVKQIFGGEAQMRALQHAYDFFYCTRNARTALDVHYGEGTAKLADEACSAIAALLADLNDERREARSPEQSSSTAVRDGAIADACQRCGKGTFGTLCAQCKGERP